jgi:lysozyme family protein
MSLFEPAVRLVLQHEGGWVDDPLDPGGATNYGISLRFYKQSIDPSATPETIHNLTVQDASNIYLKCWWNQYHYGNINAQLVADKVLDMSVLTGPFRIGKATQEAINIVNGNNNLATDGNLGPLSFAAMNAADPTRLLAAIIQQMTDFFESLTSPIARQDMQGWLNRVRS